MGQTGAFPVHPTALMVGADLGMDTKSMREVVSQVAEDNPMLLIGGYTIDVMIIATYAVSMHEDGFQIRPLDDEGAWTDTNRDQIIETINSIIGTWATDGRMI